MQMKPPLARPQSPQKCPLWGRGSTPKSGSCHARRRRCSQMRRLLFLLHFRKCLWLQGHNSRVCDVLGYFPLSSADKRKTHLIRLVFRPGFTVNIQYWEPEIFLDVSLLCATCAVLFETQAPFLDERYSSFMAQKQTADRNYTLNIFSSVFLKM